MNTTAISIDNISKHYRMWSSPDARLKSPFLFYSSKLFPNGQVRSYLQRQSASYYKDYKALDTISCKINKGDAVGIIGRNGAGKSTLLQIIAGTLQASSGDIKINGKICALLELGSGFNPAFNGKENVYLNGAILGLKKQEIDNRFNEISTFADIGDFMDQPVSTYSSGMKMRLAFAVQIVTDPDILIVDEALAVGDATFQAKCYRRLRKMLDNGLTLLLVSHTGATIRSFCNKALWLDKGKLASWGSSESVANEYEKYCWSLSGIQTGKTNKAVSQNKQNIKTSNITVSQHAQVAFENASSMERAGTGELSIINFYFIDSEGSITESIRYDEDLKAVYTVSVIKDIDYELEVGLTVRDLQGTQILSAVDYTHNIRITAKKGQSLSLEMKLRFPLRAGKYYVSTSIFGFEPGKKYQNGVIDFSLSRILDRVESACFFNILPRPSHCLYGPVHSDAELTLNYIDILANKYPQTPI